jgi:hypothetical protein
VEEFNSEVDSAAGAGEAWTQDPLDVVKNFIWGSIGHSYYTWLERQNNRLEWPDSTVITLVRDGEADDSIRGDWHRVVLYRLPDNTWRLVEAWRAFSCYRGHQREIYGKRRCL